MNTIIKSGYIYTVLEEILKILQWEDALQEDVEVDYH